MDVRITDTPFNPVRIISSQLAVVDDMLVDSQELFAE